MAGRIFEQLLDSNWRQGKKTRRSTLPISIAIHLLVLAAVIVIPILSWNDLPEPATPAVHAFFVEATAPPPPPPPPPPAAPKAPTTPKTPQITPVPKEVPQFTAPVEVPKEIQPQESTETGAGEGVPGGVPEGVEGGVEGGVVGGVVGGVIGGTVGGVVGGEGTGEPTAPVRVGGQIKEPRKLRNVAPVYPDVARQARVAGVVVLECTISPEGRVADVKVLRGIPLLNDSALSAVKQWVYSPTLLNGVPVPVIMTVTVNFRLGSEGAS